MCVYFVFAMTPSYQCQQILCYTTTIDQNLPGTANFGGSSLGSDGPSPHYAMNGNRDGEMGGAMPVFVQGSEHSPARFPARETQGHPPRMVSRCSRSHT